MYPVPKIMHMLNYPADLKQIRIGMRHNVSVSSPNPRL